MTSSWQSYPKIYNFGHAAVRDILNYPHVIEEKVDGSQFSFGVFPPADLVKDNEIAMAALGIVDSEKAQEVHPSDMELRVRSKGAVMVTDAPEKMFNKAVEHVKSIQHLLHVGWTYRGEYLQKPKHNTLAYDRIPNGHIILFDVGTGDGEWLGPDDKKAEAGRIGLECVPVLAINIQQVFEPESQEFGNPPVAHGEAGLKRLREILDNTTSVLGGQKIEGVVCKPLVPLFGVDGKTLMAKFVSERFKEAHVHAWRESNPTNGDVIQKLVKTYGVEARWLKAIQHLREAGQLEDSPKDIGKLLVEIEKDTGQECKEEIQKALWKWAWPHVARGIKGGFPEFYKQELLRKQFENDDFLVQTADESKAPDVLGTTIALSHEEWNRLEAAVKPGQRLQETINAISHSDSHDNTGNQAEAPDQAQTPTGAEVVCGAEESA